MGSTVITGLVLLISLHLFISQWILKKRFHIKSKRIGLFSKQRRKSFLIIELLIVAMFIMIYFYLNNGSNLHQYSIPIRVSPMFGLFFLLGLNRGAEEWVMNKPEKAYFHQWLGSLMVLAAFLIIFIGESV